MSKLANASPEFLANHFITYLFEKYPRNKHVRRVASWVGLILLGIEKIATRNWIPQDRQLRFDYGGRSFKARFNHKAGGKLRGGIDIVEVLPGRGAPEGKTVKSITSLKDAEKFYKSPSSKLVRRFHRMATP